MTKKKLRKPDNRTVFGWDLSTTEDKTAYMIFGPNGNITLEKPIGAMLMHMMDGHLYPFSKLAEVAGFATPSMAQTTMQAMKPRLKDIGIRVHFLGDLVRVDVER